jgi:D-glycero-D-manno-heptose 1,7-bisphosphate phosphatase
MEILPVPIPPTVDFVFLDRDGVINRKAPGGEYVFNWDEFHLLPGIDKALASLNRSGRKIIVLTNQRGVARGLYTLSQVRALHDQLQQFLKSTGAHIDAFYICPHDEGQCNCRKPRTGLLEQAFKDFPQATRANSVLIGDSRSDIQAAVDFGIASILIRDTQRSDLDAAARMANPTAVADSLEAAIRVYFSHKS